jgi:hypothetical protein
MTELHRLQAWYALQCDGDWEHEYGITIENIDNPGWTVTIPLAETELESAAFSSVIDMASPINWVNCRKTESDRGPRWEGSGGPHMLAPILRLFLDWADAQTGAT